MGSESVIDSDSVLEATGRCAASEPALPTQFYTLRECRRLFNRNLVLLVGALAVAVVTANSGAVVGFAFIGINLFRLRKMEQAMRAGSRFPKAAARTPKRFELWLWPPMVALMTIGMIWLTKIDLLRWLLHPAHSPIMFAISVTALLYLCAAWVLLLWNVRNEYRNYFAAQRAMGAHLGSMAVNETPARTITVPGEQSNALPRKSHWWTDTQSREDAKVIAKR